MNNKNTVGFKSFSACTNLAEVRMAQGVTKALERPFSNGRMVKGMICTLSKCEGEKQHAVVTDLGFEMLQDK